MWILVVGSSALLTRKDGGVAMLTELGCRVRSADLWDALDQPEYADEPPAAILVEALDQYDAGKAALMRIRAVPLLVEVPCLVAVTVGQTQRLDGNDGFDDFIHEELIPDPAQRTQRAVYIEYGEPFVAPNGDVYLWQKSDANYTILKWTWK